MFIAIFYGVQIIWERDAGILNKLLVTPTPRSALIIGKAFAAGVKSLVQAVVVLLVAALLGVALTWNPLKLLAVAAIVVLGSAFFSCLSMTIAGTPCAGSCSARPTTWPPTSRCCSWPPPSASPRPPHCWAVWPVDLHSWK
jgi:ABC-type multidrug transport system permease subunit